MFKDIGETLRDYAIVGTCIGGVSVLIKPFVSIKQTIRDAVISFIFSMLAGLLLEYVDIPYSVKVGLSGIVGLFAVRLYMIIESVLKKVEENPDVVIDKIKNKLD
nr:MAG TPA: LydA holin phage, holin superfamily III [Caudoviricetes sp.]